METKPEDKKDDLDYGFGITQKDVDEYSKKPRYLHNKPVREDGKSFAEFINEKPFMDGYSEEEKKKVINEIRVAGGLDEI